MQQWQPRVLDVAVLCLVGLSALIVTAVAVANAWEREPRSIPLVIAAVAGVAATVLIWRNGPIAPLARLLGLAVVAAFLWVAGSVLLAVLVGVLLAADLVTHDRQPTA